PGKLLRVPMFPPCPPLAYAGVSKKITHGSLDLTPHWRTKNSIAEREVHSLEVMKEAILKRAKSKFGQPIQIVERMHAAKVQLTELNAVMHGFCEIAPTRRQSVHRCLAALPGLFPDLDREINERRDSDKRRCQLPKSRKHLPVHAISFPLTRYGRLTAALPS